MSEILQNAVTKEVKFKTTIHFKNGAKETIFHDKAPMPDGVMRLLHFAVADNQGVAYNMDDIRKFETQAFVENKVNIIT